MPYPHPLAGVLKKIETLGRADIDDYEDDGEWFFIDSDYPDTNLFQLLRQQWSAIAGPHAHCFALIHCANGKDSGVWLHFLEGPEERGEYLAGCHSIPNW